MPLFTGAFSLLSIALALSAAESMKLDSSHVIFHFHGTDTTSDIGWSIGGLGDINGDGFDDIYTSSWSPLGTYVFLGGNPPDTLPDMFLRGWVWGAADLTGDGVKEVYSSYVYDPWTAPWGVMYFYRGYEDSLGSVPYDSVYTATINWGLGTVMRGGFVDGDSLGDLLVCAPDLPGGQGLYYYSGCPAFDKEFEWSYIVANTSHYLGPYSDNFGFIDWNGDGQKDIYAGMYADLDTTSHVYIFLGPSFGSSPAVVLNVPYVVEPWSTEAFARGVFNVADVNGDGWEELAVEYLGDILIYRCGPSADTLYDYVLSQPYDMVASAGDINGDGQPDLVAGQYHRSQFGGVQVYLGGTKWDIYRDGSLGKYDLPPLLLERIGWRVASAGDFNGDGIGDFMFSCGNFSDGHPGDVFVAKGGTDIVTGVDDKSSGTLPGELHILPNYPNPFNPTTTVEFELARVCRVTVDVLNVLGQRVSVLAEAVRLSAGRHSYSWDGQLAEGAPAPSGMYFLRITTPTATGTQKMMLVK